MIKIDKIYLDLDGVLSDFVSTYDFNKNPKEVWREKFPEFVANKGFEKLNMLPDADDLITYLYDYDVTILTSAGGMGMYDEIVKQKLNWLEAMGITYPTIVTPNKDAKAKYACPCALLIDDQPYNTTIFAEAGGHSITHTSAKSTIEVLNTTYMVKRNA